MALRNRMYAYTDLSLALRPLLRKRKNLVTDIVCENSGTYFHRLLHHPLDRQTQRGQVHLCHGRYRIFYLRLSCYLAW